MICSIMGYKEDIISNCTRCGILLDTELLLLLCVGLFDPAMVERHKKANKYTLDDFERIDYIVGKFNPLYVSPQILAEFSNHSDRLGSKVIREFYKSIEKILKEQFEVYIPKDVIIEEDYLPALGFADVSILKICEEKRCVLFTADWQLEGICRAKGLEVVNFNHILGTKWFSDEINKIIAPEKMPDCPKQQQAD